MLLSLLLPTLALAQPCGFAQQAERGPDRPDDTSAILESGRDPIVLHYDPAWTPDPTALLAEIEIAWENNLGWGLLSPPDDFVGPDDRFDVYVSQTQFGGYVAPEGWWERPDGVGCTSHMVLNREIPLEALLSIIHHEMHHAFQSATDCVESVALLESDATFVQDWTLPETPYGLLAFVPAFQGTPERPVNDAEWGMPYQYGASLWRWFLAERFGDGTPSFTASLWVAGMQPEFDNEPDWLDVLDELLAQQDTTAAAAYEEFSVWRLLLGARATAYTPWARGLEWPVDETTLQVQGSHDARELPLDGPGPAAAGPFGSVYVEVSDLGAGPVDLAFWPDSPDVPWSATALLVRPDGQWEATPLVEGEDGWALSLEVDDGDAVVLIANNLTPHDPDAYEDWGDQRATFRYAIVGPPTGDDDDAADDDDDVPGLNPTPIIGGTGCTGCSAAPGGSWLPLLLLGLRRRR